MMTGGEYRVDLRFSKVLIFRAKNSRLNQAAVPGGNLLGFGVYPLLDSIPTGN